MKRVGNHYQVLGVSPLATQEEIRAGYQSRMRRLQRKVEEGTPPPVDYLDAVSAAYATLRDPERRKAYDAGLDESGLNPPLSPPPASPPGQRPPGDSEGSNELWFAFHGSGSEYFRIWIVNLLLSIVTLGIYSAWAKVRREQYFHRNLVLDGAGFDYHARPRAILIGRCIALGLFIGVSVAQRAGPFPHLLALAAAAGVAPWLIMRALRFRTRNTSYRGLRFSFSGDYRSALIAFVGYGLLTLVTFGILAPLWIRQMRLYVANHLRYGNSEFVCDVPNGPFFRVVFMPGLVILGMFVLMAILSMAGSVGKILSALLMLCVFFVYLAGIAYVRMGLNNLIWNNVTLGEHRFHSEMKFKSYLGIVIKNWLLTVVTLGLYWPWAKVRLAAYRASCTALVVAGSLDGFVAGAGEDVAAFGDEAAEMFDIDIAL